MLSMSRTWLAVLGRDWKLESQFFAKEHIANLETNGILQAPITCGNLDWLSWIIMWSVRPSCSFFSSFFSFLLPFKAATDPLQEAKLGGEDALEAHMYRRWLRILAVSVREPSIPIRHKLYSEAQWRVALVSKLRCLGTGLKRLTALNLQQSTHCIQSSMLHYIHTSLIPPNNLIEKRQTLTDPTY